MNVSDESQGTKLSGLLSTTAPNKVFIAIVLGIVAGIGYALIVPLVLLSLKPPLPRIMQSWEAKTYYLLGNFEVSTPKLAAAFFAICLLILICRGISQALLTRIATDATVNLRKSVYQKIAWLPIEDMEKIGPSRLLAALTNDVPQVVGGAAAFPGLLVTITTLIGLLGFMLYLNVKVFFFIISIILIGIITYRVPLYFGERVLTKSRKRFDKLYEGMRGLIYGAKELKLNQFRLNDFLDKDLNSIEEEISRYKKRGDTLIVFGVTYGDLICFFSIGVVTYVMANYYALSREHLVGVVMVMFYITGPVSVLLNSIGPIIQASVSAKQLQRLVNEMPVESSWGEICSPSCNRIALHGVEYTHKSEYKGEEGFHVGPIDLSLQRAEVTFLVGGNGSGKTTLGKLLSLHYIPRKGEIYFDGSIVTDRNRSGCRQNISAIYSDFYLFSQLFGLNTEKLNSKATKYLKELSLDGKVSIENGNFSNTKLSDGQKKRLALLVTYLEDRDLYVFDEWAADQDPLFKEVFYLQILPSLKRAQKIVVVITHDDRYFQQADKIVRMENGKIDSIEVLRENKSISHENLG